MRTKKKANRNHGGVVSQQTGTEQAVHGQVATEKAALVTEKAALATENLTDRLGETDRWTVNGETVETVLQLNSENEVTDQRADVAEDVESAAAAGAVVGEDAAAASVTRENLNDTVDPTKLILVPVESSPSRSVKVVELTTGEQ